MVDSSRVSETLQRLPQEVSQCVSHRLPAVVWHGRWQRRLAPHSPQGCFKENRGDSLKDKRQRRKAQAAATTENPDLDLHVPTLHKDLPVSRRPPQPRTGLQSAWTTTFLIFVRAARTNNLFPFVKIPWTFASFYFDGNKYLHKTRWRLVSRRRKTFNLLQAWEKVWMFHRRFRFGMKKLISSFGNSLKYGMVASKYFFLKSTKP